jgi:phenylacetate 2-hydroxylase
MSYQTFGLAFIAVVYFLIRYFNRTDVPKIENLPEIPGVPIFGNLLQFGSSHARVAAKFAEKYGPVFQVRLGNRVCVQLPNIGIVLVLTLRKRIVFANTFDSVKHLWITNQSALISRPTLHTFHSVVSTSQGFTIVISDWTTSLYQI